MKTNTVDLGGVCAGNYVQHTITGKAKNGFTKLRVTMGNPFTVIDQWHASVRDVGKYIAKVVKQYERGQ